MNLEGISPISILNWILFFVLFLQPILRKRALEAQRQVGLRAIELKRNSRVISLIHRRETVNILGFPLVQYLDIQDSEAILRAIRLTPADMPLDVIIHTPAGLSLAAEQVARALSRHKGKITVFVPHYAMSGGTLIAISADELVMAPDAVLGSLDPQVGQYPAASVIALGQRKTPDQLTDGSFVMLDQARKAVTQVRAAVIHLAGRRLGREQAEKMADALTSGQWTQDYPISIEEAREMGLSISTDMPAEVYDYMNLFPQASQQRPSVDFIPMPYRQTDREGGDQLPQNTANSLRLKDNV